MKPRCLPALLLLASLSVSGTLTADEATPAPHASPDWIQDALVIAMPAAAVGGCQAGVYTSAVNGVRPWRQALVRWLTGWHVMGNTAVLVRQEGAEGGAGLSAIVDRHADYLFQVDVILPAGSGFGQGPKDELQLWLTVLGTHDEVIAEAPAKPTVGKWAECRLAFSSGDASQVRCVVRARSPRQLPAFYYVEKFRLTRTDQSWWSPQNLFDAAPTASRLPDQRELLLRTLDPDVVGGHNGVYLNGDGFFTAMGVLVGGGQWEQEYNHAAVEDPASQQFLDNGVSRTLDGQPVTKGGLWPGYNMCHNAPAWHLYHQQRLARIAPDVQLLSQDNVASPSFSFRREKVCFCRWCCDGFRDWLRLRWTAGQFHAADIADPAAFDVAQYCNRVLKARISKGRDAVLSDPVLRAFIQFQYVSQLDRWRDTVAAVKKAAGHPVAICGNQGGANGKLPYSVALSQIGDAIPVETWGDLNPQTRAWNALACKLGLAAGEFRRPVWLWMTEVFSSTQAARSRLRLSGAQALADGGVPIPWATAPGASGWFYDEEARRSRFAQRHRALLTRRERCANVGLVYSLPTHAWRKFSSFNLSSEPYSSWFGAWARLLEESHVPYEAVCWWHSLLGDERVAMERLSRYQVLVLPGVDCFSDAQREAVRKFQARGGRVISMACPTLYDADAVARPAGETLATPGDRLVEIRPEHLMQYARKAANAQDLRNLVHRTLGQDHILQTESPSGVWADVWLDDTRQVLALHLVNGDIDQEADRFRPVEGSRWRLRLPAGLAVTEALAITPDDPNCTQPLPVEVADGWATVIVPKIESYTVVALYSGKSLAAAEHVANARRKLWRASIIRGGRPDAGLSAELQKVVSLLRAGQVEAGALAAADLARRSGDDAVRPAGGPP
jgi:hypothetical protein